MPVDVLEISSVCQSLSHIKSTIRRSSRNFLSGFQSNCNYQGEILGFLKKELILVIKQGPGGDSPPEATRFFISKEQR